MVKKDFFEKFKLKLDKNNDGLISLNEYLSATESKGPKAKPGKINYHYQSFDNIINYFIITLRQFTEYKILCVPDFIYQFDGHVGKAGMIISLEDYEIIMGNNIKNAIKDCFTSDVRFIFINLILKIKKNYNHANGIIIDLQQKTLERFEPHGSYYYSGVSKYEIINRNINKLFENTILKKMGLNKFTYLAPYKISPKYGVQIHADAFCGMCVTISMMYLHLRLLNPDIQQKKIVKFLIDRPKNKLKEMILKYASHVEQVLKFNESHVLDLFMETFHKINEN